MIAIINLIKKILSMLHINLNKDASIKDNNSDRSTFVAGDNNTVVGPNTVIGPGNTAIGQNNVINGQKNIAIGTRNRVG
jgi:hypothetical protein